MDKGTGPVRVDVEDERGDVEPEEVPAGPTGDTTLPETDLQKGEWIVIGMAKIKWTRVRNELMEVWDRLGTPIVNKKSQQDVPH